MTHPDDKTAPITGGGRGIGRAIALQLAQRGARVAVSARSEDELVETTSTIAAAGGHARAIVADLAAPGAGTELARRALDELGRVDILINNAAVVAPLGASTGIDLEAFAGGHWRSLRSVLDRLLNGEAIEDRERAAHGGRREARAGGTMSIERKQDG